MTVLVPTAVEEVVDVLRTRPDAMLLAGGTDLLVQVNAGRTRPEFVVALRNVEELRSVEVTGSTVRIGAGVTYRRLLDDDIVRAAPALAQAARTVGSPQIRNAGTIGGNLATASPAGDTLPVLVALGATVEIAGSAGRRTLPVREFFTGPKRTALAPGDVITSVSVPVVPGKQEFRKVGVRNAMVIAVASVALAFDSDRRAVALAMGSVAPVPLLAAAAGGWITDQLQSDPAMALDDETVRTFAAMVAEEARPIDDHRGTAAYRRHAVSVLAARSLRAVLGGGEAAR